MIQADAANPGMSDTANTMLLASSNVLGASLNNDQVDIYSNIAVYCGIWHLGNKGLKCGTE